MSALVVSADEAAEALGLHVNTVYELCHRGELRAGKVGRRWLIPRAELAAFLNRVTGVDLAAERAKERFDEAFAAYTQGIGGR